MTQKPIIVDFKELVFKVNNRKINIDFIEKAFGKNSLGLIIVKNVPDFSEIREKFLKIGRKFMTIKDKTKYEVPDAYYAVGWSYGKEKMKNNLPDFAKGSYYANPVDDDPSNGDKELIKKYPGSYHPNVWPDDELPEFKQAFKKLGELISIVGLLILNYCDRHMEEKGYKTELEKLIMNSKTHKGRFLHYFPSKKELNKEDDGLCGWHCDSGALTGLISASYFDKDGKEIDDPEDSGLHIKDRNNNLVKVTIPKDCIAFQIGEIIQILTGGELIATPHCVKSTKMENVTRNTLAIFMDLHPQYEIHILDTKMKKEDVVHIKNLPNSVPQMEDRFYDGITYAEFLDKTYKAYYN